MIIEVLDQKYSCGCNRGMAKLEKPNLLMNLNSIIEWNKCTFPLKEDSNLSKGEISNLKDKLRELSEKYNLEESEENKKELEKEFNAINKKLYVEDKKFLGDNPKLSPGDTFAFEKGQIISVENENTLILVISETGVNALERIWKETIEPELKMLLESSGNIEVNWEVMKDGEEIDKNFFDKEYRPNYKIYKNWKENFLPKEGITDKTFKIKVTLVSDNFVVPIKLIMKNWSILYNSIQISEEQLEDTCNELLWWFKNNY